MNIVLGDHIRVHEIIIIHKKKSLCHFHYIFENMNSKKFAALESSSTRSNLSSMAARIGEYAHYFIFNSLDEALEKSIMLLDDPNTWDSTLFPVDKK